MEMTNWKTLLKKESWGKYKFGIEVRVALDRELNENDKKATYKLEDLIEDAVMRETVRVSPDEQRERDAEKEHFLACFPDGMLILAEAIPNGYCSRWCCEMSPWYKVTTPKGVVIIGWRKRVIELSWEDRVNIDAANLFPDEQPTKIGRMIHAYGYDKAKQYISRLLSS